MWRWSGGPGLCWVYPTVLTVRVRDRSKAETKQTMKLDTEYGASTTLELFVLVVFEPC